MDNKRLYFNTQINKQLQNGLKYSNQFYSILGNACNRMLIDKTFWKGLVLPNILYASEIITFTIEEIKEFPKLDNRAYRFILNL